MPFWPFTDRNLGYRIQLIINYEALVLRLSMESRGKLEGTQRWGQLCLHQHLYSAPNIMNYINKMPICLEMYNINVYIYKYI